MGEDSVDGADAGLGGSERERGRGEGNVSTEGKEEGVNTCIIWHLRRFFARK